MATEGAHAAGPYDAADPAARASRARASAAKDPFPHQRVPDCDQILGRQIGGQIEEGLRS